MMNQDNDVNDILQQINEKCLNLLKRLEGRPDYFLKIMDQWFALTADLQAFITILLTYPDSIHNMYAAYWQDVLGLLQERNSSILDKRFSASEWVEQPFYYFLSRHYLLVSNHLNALLEHLQFNDPQLAKRLRFFTRQYLDALSPANFLQTNPQLLAETVQSQGKNLLVGLQNLLTDIDAESLRLVMTMTDRTAFKVGETLAVTPGYVIYRNDLMELIQYTPKTIKVKSVPLLIIPPWINKYYILDLSPHNSLVRWLVDQGIVVFIISWVNPDSRHADKGLAEYLQEGPLAAIKTIQTQLSVKQVNALGFCIGGTLLAMVLAYNKAKQDTSIRCATFLATLIDFSEPGDIAVFIDEPQITKIEQRMEEKGYLEGHLMASAFNSLRASDLVWAIFIRNYLQAKPPVPFDLLFWNADTTNMPFKMQSEYLRWMYLHNDLVKPGKICLQSIPLDMSQITIPTFFVATQKDHIAPWETVYQGFKLMQGKKRFLLGGSGHIAGIVIPPGGEKYGYYLNGSCPDSPNDWLTNATYHTGSWWPEWFSWLHTQSGRFIKAPLFAKLPFKPLMEAPGEYVLNTEPRLSNSCRKID